MKYFKCIYCKEIKTENEFYHDKSKLSGYKPRCKKCDLLSKGSKTPGGVSSNGLNILPIVIILKV
jgi:hypothetical protein